MAVVQISRIQIRRGQKNQGSGLPQLASGELGWAIDAQELYIGNGAVSEGAPYVGNTKILSEHDNLFEFASNYIYREPDDIIQTGTTTNSPVLRSLQDRLDDRVSVRSFGLTGDNTNQTVALQRAIDQLYLNAALVSNPQSRVILHMEPGRYTISSTIYIPPYVTLMGAGKEKTIINYTGTGSAFQTVNGASTVGNPASDAVSTTNNQARHIYMSGFTLNVPSGTKGFLFESCRNSVFENIKISGVRTLGSTLSTDEVAMDFTSLSSVVTCKNNKFTNIDYESISYAVRSDYDIYDNHWKECNFTTLGQGVAFGEETIIGTSGQLTGPFNNTIESCIFNDVEKQGIRVKEGTGNKSHGNRYYAVGNDGGSSLNPVTPVIQFDDYENSSENDWFERSEDLQFDPTYIATVQYIPEVSGAIIYENNYTSRVRVSESASEYVTLFRLPANIEKGFEIDYLYRSNQVNATRSGVLKIVVDPDDDQHKLSDEYEYVGNSLYEESLNFSTTVFALGGAEVDTLAVTVLNSTPSDDADFYYRVKTKA